MAQAKLPYICFVYEEHYGVLVRGYSRRVRAVIEHRHLGNSRAGPLNVNHLLAPVEALAEAPHSTFDDDVYAARLSSRHKEYLAARESLFHSPRRQSAELVFVELTEQGSLSQGS